MNHQYSAHETLAVLQRFKDQKEMDEGIPVWLDIWDITDMAGGVIRSVKSTLFYWPSQNALGSPFRLRVGDIEDARFYLIAYPNGEVGNLLGTAPFPDEKWRFEDTVRT